MSYDIRLVDPVTKEPLHSDVTHDMRGGTYQIGSTTELWNTTSAREIHRIIGTTLLQMRYVPCISLSL